MNGNFPKLKEGSRYLGTGDVQRVPNRYPIPEPDKETTKKSQSKIFDRIEET